MLPNCWIKAYLLPLVKVVSPLQISLLVEVRCCFHPAMEGCSGGFRGGKGGANAPPFGGE